MQVSHSESEFKKNLQTQSCRIFARVYSLLNKAEFVIN